MLSMPTSKGVQENSVIPAGKSHSNRSVRTLDQMEQQLDYVVDLIATDRTAVTASVDQVLATDEAACTTQVLKMSVILSCRHPGLALRSLLASAKEKLSELAIQYELILVDAVWHKASVEVCKELGITLAVAPRNRLGSMRAIGVRNATGDILTFVDVEDVAALTCLRDHVGQFLKGCDAVQSGRSYCPVDVPPSSDQGKQKFMAVRDVMRQVFSQCIQAAIGVTCGAKISTFESSVQSVRRSVWDQLYLTEPGAAASLELSLRCGWLGDHLAETSSAGGIAQRDAPSIRESCHRLYDALRIAFVQRPDRMIVTPAVVTFVVALALLAWTVLSARMLGSMATMVWMGAASVTMMVAALWITAGWLATEYARQRKWMPPASRHQSYLRTISTQTSFTVGGGLIVAGMLMMSLGAWLGCGESTWGSSSSPWTMANLMTWVWPGATLTLIGHQFSMTGMLVSWFRRQPLQ